MDHSLADLTRITGAKRRSVQLWAEAGVIQAKAGTDRAGTGVHRRFSRDEAIIACLIAAFSLHFQSPIGTLIKLSKAMRAALAHDAIKELVEEAVRGEARAYLELSAHFDGEHNQYSMLFRRLWDSSDRFAEIGRRAVEHADRQDGVFVLIQIGQALKGLR